MLVNTAIFRSSGSSAIRVASPAQRSNSGPVPFKPALSVFLLLAFLVVFEVLVPVEFGNRCGSSAHPEPPHWFGRTVTVRCDSKLVCPACQNWHRIHGFLRTH